jgi:hypothetical protein
MIRMSSASGSSRRIQKRLRSERSCAQLPVERGGALPFTVMANRQLIWSRTIARTRSSIRVAIGAVEANDRRRSTSPSAELETGDAEKCLLGIGLTDPDRWDRAADDLSRVLTRG